MKTSLHKRKTHTHKRYEIDCNNSYIKPKLHKKKLPPLTKSMNVSRMNNDNIINDVNEDNEEFKDIMNYLNNLDYEKYKHDFEMKEALMILKHKMEKENENKKEEITKDEDIYYDEDDELDKLIEKCERELHNEEVNDVKEQMVKLIEEKEQKEENVDVLKYRLACKLAKMDPLLSAVHSTRSVQMLLMKSGVDVNDIGILNDKMDSCLKSKLTLHKEQYPPNLLPHLHSRVVLPQSRNVSV